MLSENKNRLASPLLPDDLKELLASRTPDKRIGITIIDKQLLRNGQESRLISEWLTGEEHHQLTRYSFEKRRKEWFLGRICAKQATLDLLNTKNGAAVLRPLDLNIEIGPGGRPFVRMAQNNQEETGLDISISHSHRKVAGIAARAHCGIDIQFLTDTLFKVKDRYCTETEAALLDGTEEDELIQLGLLWAAKEAVKKCLSTSGRLGFQAMQLESIRPEQGYQRLELALEEPYGQLGSVSAIAHVHDGYVLAVCIIATDLLNA